MRLIHTKTLELEDFSHGIPPYAILSHTWEYDQEISFQEWQQDRHNVCDRTGYTKIQNACAQAQQRGLDYLWVDTNCIDKSSSAELSEAINSMFSWYQQTQVCFVYLSDVTTTAAATLPAQSMTCGEEPPPPQHSPLSEARWWSRGWTLQELLAPNKLVFFSGSWEPIGVINKADGATSKNTPYQDFTTSVSAITGIGRVFLLGLQSLSEASIALRMSWAASRVTTRVEDMSYCLMGLFGINMPLLYGEGERAFQRLQHLIMGVSTDQSIFAWEWTQNTSYKEGDLSLIAPSPTCFARSGDFFQLEDRTRSIAANTFVLTNTGLSLRLPIQSTSRTGLAFALLGCSHRYHSKIDQYRLCIPIRLGAQSPEGMYMVERLPWPALPLSIALFSPTLHMLHIPRKAAKPHSSFEGLPSEFLHRSLPDAEYSAEYSVFLLFRPSKHPYLVRDVRPSHNPLGKQRGAGELRYDSIGLIQFHGQAAREDDGAQSVGAIVEIEHQRYIVWVHFRIYRLDNLVFKACHIVKVQRKSLSLSLLTRGPSHTNAGSTPSNRRRSRYTIEEAVASIKRQNSLWSDPGVHGSVHVFWSDTSDHDFLRVEMGVHAIDGCARVIVPVYIDFDAASRRGLKGDRRGPKHLGRSVDWPRK